MHRHFQPIVATRLDLAISAAFPDISRRAARRLIEQSSVLINGRVVAVASRLVSPEDEIAIVEASAGLTILAYSDDWIAVDKPSGMPTQPTRDRTVSSLAEVLAVQLKREKDNADLFVIHRLDLPTSGVVLFARSKESAGRLSAFFAKRQIVKTYLAIVTGTLDKPLSLDLPIERQSPDAFRVGKGGREAVTKIRPLAAGHGVSLAEITIATGRTHQIRVHLQAAGHSIAGDRKYGDRAVSASRLLLHAAKLVAPSIGEIQAPLPADFLAEAKRLGIQI